MSVWIIWLIAAAVLIIVEVLSQMVWTLCLAIGCVVATGAALCGADIEVQLICVAISTLLSFAIIAPRLKRWLHYSRKKEPRDDRTGMDALLGRKGIVTHEIKPGELGRVRIDGDSWQAGAPGVETTIKRGENVTVTGYDSIILSVK